MVACTKYIPLPTDAAFCTCNLKWGLHSEGARCAFWSTAGKDDINKMVSACKRDNEAPCKKYTPSQDWPIGESAPGCTCGRPLRPSHTPGDILEGMREWRLTHPRGTTNVVTSPPVSKSPCGHFHGTLTTPGTCCICDNKWINHSSQARSLAIEAFYDEHEHWCKCIIMNGDVECSCLTDVEKQDALDDIGHVPHNDTVKKVEKVTTIPMGCKQFKPKSTGNTHCQCGTPFHMHTTTATDGEASFLSWRASHLSNKELLTWFQLLPGKNREERTTYLKQLLADPNLVFVPPANIVNPDYNSMLALLDALTGSHHIQSPTDIEKIEAKRRGEDITVEDGKHYCHACSKRTATLQGQMCDDCEQVFMPKSGPALIHTAGKELTE